EAQLRLFPQSFAKKLGIWICGRRMGLVLTLLAFEIPICVAASSGRRIIRTVSRPKTLQRRPSFNQRAIDAEMLVTRQPGRLGLSHDLLEERLRDIGLHESIAVLAERRVIPYPIVDRQPHEPPKQQVVVELLTEQSLAAYRVKNLQQQRPDQLLRWDRWTTHLRVRRLELSRHLHKSCIDHHSNSTQRMSLRNPALCRHIAEKAFLMDISTAHRARSDRKMLKFTYSRYWPKGSSGTFSTAC